MVIKISSLDSDTRKLIEAALFISAEPLSLDDLSKIVNISSIGYVKNMLQDLIDDYAKRDTAMKIEELDKKYLLTLKSPYMEKVSSLAAKPDLSKGALRILAYISKNEPILQSKIVNIFGPSSYSYIKEILEKSFIESSKSGRTKKLKTTEKFKEYFELNQ
ncbi:chromosome segregation and condensation protein B [Candidatus Mancarchaeum acidiphilum]|uniref:Chromosome segregation and condensation protein B n=1 Tax=Candidatus Mancarchaeum acidiphilum TaxID=1920749 RepID=A0A218NMI0_9ARCH|nr:SMC-Scp complex subunit ScpB [Candidatus Mancarchaeum acidiphilum]ASI13673.1 chromosome segregation and condensation protein B [Candidatus Mancarchaeum acidiphilum]